MLITHVQHNILFVHACATLKKRPFLHVFKYQCVEGYTEILIMSREFLEKVRKNPHYFYFLQEFTVFNRRA